MLDTLFEEKYDELVTAWSQHQRLRKRRAPLGELAASRHRVDHLRDVTNTLRRAHSPSRLERESILLTAYCDTFGEPVFLFSADADWSTGAPRYRCICGQRLEVSSAEACRSATETRRS